jgi:HK97 family phage prohead protease
MTDATRLTLERKRAGAPLARIEPDGTFIGYASLFGVRDLAGDMVEPGAFAASLARKGTRGVRMLYQHDPGEPIGAWLFLAEDTRGLLAHGRLTEGVSRAREVLALMRAGALDGLSIGFRCLRSAPDAKTRARRIIEADLWEISIVTFPMLPGARVHTVKTLMQRTGGGGLADLAPCSHAQLAGRIRQAARLLNERTGRP